MFENINFDHCGAKSRGGVIPSNCVGGRGCVRHVDESEEKNRRFYRANWITLNDIGGPQTCDYDLREL